MAEAATYGLKYYKAFRSRGEAGGELWQLEIRQKGLDASVKAKEIGGWQGLSLELDGDDDPVSPIQKTIVTFSMVDAWDEPDTDGVKFGGWDEFFTPDSTMYKVVIRRGEDGDVFWSGYITPDNWQESLEYRGTVTITARDNIGHLQDFDFDMEADEAGTVTVRALILAAMERIGFPMTLRMLLSTEGNSDYRGVVYDEVQLPYFRVNVSHFKDMTWSEALEEVLSSLGLCIRYVGGNTMAVTYLRFLPLLGSQGRPSLQELPVKFLGGGTRTLDPAYKKIVETLKYDFEEEAQFDVTDGADIGQNSARYTYASRYDNPDFDTIQRGTGYCALNGGGEKGWQYGAGFLNPDDLELIDRYSTNAFLDKVSTVLIAANSTGAANLTRTYRFCQIAKPSGIIRIQFDPNCYLTIKSASITSCPSHFSKMTWALRYEVAGKSYYLNKSTKGLVWASSIQIFTYSDSASDSLDLDFSVDLSDAAIPGGGDLFLLIDNVIFEHTVFYFPYEVDQTTTETRDTTTGIYMGVRGISLVVSENAKLDTDTTTTVNDESYNVTESRDPGVGFLSREVGWQTPQNYENAIFYENEERLVAPVVGGMAWDEDGAKTEPFPALLHRQVLMYHHLPMQLLEGDCMPEPGAPWEFDRIVTYKGRRFLVQGGTYDFVSGIMSGARLREFQFYDDLWADTFTVRLTSAGSDRLAVVKALVSAAGLTPAGAKRIVDNAPADIGSGYGQGQAESIRDAVAAAGGTAEITAD